MLYCRAEDRLRLIEVAPGIQHVVDPGAVLGPLLDFLEVAVVRDQRIIGIFVGVAYRGWIVLWRQTAHVDFGPAFSAQNVLGLKGQRRRISIRLDKALAAAFGVRLNLFGDERTRAIAFGTRGDLYGAARKCSGGSADQSTCFESHFRRAVELLECAGY